MPEASTPNDETTLVVELRRTLGRLDSALGQIREGLVLVNAIGQVLWTNASFDKFIGKSRLEILGEDLHGILPLNIVGEPILTIEQTRGGLLETVFVTVILSDDPVHALEIEWRPVVTEVPNPLMFSFRDVSARISFDELQQKSQQIEEKWLSTSKKYIDLQSKQLALAAKVMKCPVTGLPNRRGLRARIAIALQQLRRKPGLVTLLFCDLNRFKEVNDSYGHQVGDELLIELGKRLQSTLRPEDVLARLGGDEFVVLSPDVPTPMAAVRLAERLQALVSKPWISQDYSISPSMSVGIASTDDPEVTVDELLRRADLAMYAAKGSDERSVTIYDNVIDTQVRRGVLVKRQLQSAIDSDLLKVDFQPIVDLKSRDSIGFEALVRIRDCEGAWMSPIEFIPVAESVGLIDQMGDLVLRRCLAVLKLTKNIAPDLVIAINISPLQVCREGLAGRMIAIAERYEIDLARLAVEVTESVLIDRPRTAINELSTLRAAGCRVYLDDFGTGYSSMSWLSQLPIDAIKIDRSFTAGLLNDPRRRVVVDSMIRLSLDLGLDVIAEGVELEAQAEALLAMGCLKGQGFLFGHPAPFPQPAEVLVP
ncbi:sensor domain-containing phosphodiesterase [Cyanobium sp. Maggiore-St4-Cus]|uniref:sensor domain-containing protein n=1 Tax=Cyanobium sp. Maggiore-St4-Cus TaxID=2823717 RepID=UPI0020CC369F|nr:sensor domain-containing phosphodiesterase [Cyanobium sp. Maggiore-St4-Cus]MCP9788473.1 sensor domain-containing phosphodiesterase [Cyanobium sp. Maggiore-St4-Cus]